jgi:4-amino-4-deoxy-L-arabinose transferase-like glycosyltransferase
MKKILFILLIFLITITTRLFELENTPGFLTNDEAAIAYNAYSIAKTGKDEYGFPKPFTFKSFNDYKAPVYIYLLSPLTQILENNKTTVRLPSAIAGCLTVLVAGFLFYQLTSNFYLSLGGSFLLSITPWHIAQSRTAMETNLALFFLTLGIWLLLKHKQWLSSLILALSLYTYHTEKIFVPLFIFIFQWKKWFKYLAFWLMFFAALLPMAIDYYHQSISGKPQDSKWFWVEASTKSVLEDPKIPVLSKGITVTRTFFVKYIQYLNPGYLFINGLTLFSKQDAIQSGLFLLPEMILIIIGLVKFKQYILKKHQSSFVWWLILLQVAPALTLGGANLNRHLIAVIPFSLLAAIGLHWISTNTKYKIITYIFLFFSFSIFAIKYYGLYRLESQENFQWGYEQIGLSISENKYYENYDKIIVDKRFGDNNLYVGAPHLFIAYFSKLDPKSYQTSTTKYEIKEINWNEEKPIGKLLYITPIDNLPPPSTYKTIEDIRLSNGVIEFKLIEYTPLKRSST